jgi:hypothetical protein
MESLEVIKGNTATFTSTVTGLDSLVGYTAGFIVKKNMKDADKDKIFEVAGEITGLVAKFTISKEQNTQTPDMYWFEVYLQNGDVNYTIDQGWYKIKPSVKF